VVSGGGERADGRRGVECDSKIDRDVDDDNKTPKNKRAIVFLG